LASNSNLVALHLAAGIPGRPPMIVEFRTYGLKPHTVAQAEENFGNAI
jgi:hypothetical protein